jgi:hypothetical protein
MAVNRGGRVVGRRVYRKLEHLERLWEAGAEEEEEEEDDDDAAESRRKEERRARNDMHVIEISAHFSCNQSVLAHFAKRNLESSSTLALSLFFQSHQRTLTLTLTLII